jgi:hypothetical protein
MAGVKKGTVNNPNGRPKGVPNKATMIFKERLNGLLEHCADDMIKWLEQIDDPKQRFDVLKDFAEYIYPKLARTDIQPLGKDGLPTDQPKIITNMILSKISSEELEAAIDQATNTDNS